MHPRVGSVGSQLVPVRDVDWQHCHEALVTSGQGARGVKGQIEGKLNEILEVHLTHLF